jgi:2-phospho-L-lactate guanylyltransferase (CobY/MobA/RfbA family)
MEQTLSEKQLESFLEDKKEERDISLSLRGQGGTTVILTEALNLCEVQIGEVSYLFGGISEDFYDNMVEEYHQKVEY